MEKQVIQTIDDYIVQFPEEIRAILVQLRKVIKDVAKEATEKISYQMPCFYYQGNLVYFAVHKNHIGFYPTSSGVEAFKAELKTYHTSTGAIQFPLEKPLPYDLIAKIVAYRVNENKNKQ